MVFFLSLFISFFLPTDWRVVVTWAGFLGVRGGTVEFCNDILALFFPSVLLRITWYFLFRTLFTFFFAGERGLGWLAGWQAVKRFFSSFFFSFFILFDSGGFVCY